MAAAKALGDALEKAFAALARNDAADAERQAKAISAMVRAGRDLAEWQAQADAPEHDDEALRAELRRRLVLFAQADLAGAPPEVLERIATEDVSK